MDLPTLLRHLWWDKVICASIAQKGKKVFFYRNVPSPRRISITLLKDERMEACHGTALFYVYYTQHLVWRVGCNARSPLLLHVSYVVLECRSLGTCRNIIDRHRLIQDKMSSDRGQRSCFNTLLVHMHVNTCWFLSTKINLLPFFR